MRPSVTRNARRNLPSFLRLAAAGEKRPNPTPHIFCTDFPKRAVGRDDLITPL